MPDQIPELTQEQFEDFLSLARALDDIARANEVVRRMAGKYIDFIDAYEAKLRQGVTVDGLHLGLKVSRKLLAFETPNE